MSTEQPFSTGARFDGKRAWDERYGDAYAQARNWRLLGIGSMLTALILAGAYAVESHRDKVQTVFVAVDNIGQVVASGPVGKNAKVPPAAIKLALVQWVENIRTVYRDSIAQKAALAKAYALLTPAAQKFVNDNVRDDPSANPFTRMKEESVAVERVNYLPVSDNTVQLTWTEIVRTLAGDIKSTKKYQANITYLAEPPTNPQDAAKNPLGLQIKSVSWAELQ